ncbi:hypothetical protein BDQ94DRAFT_136362 [Aspergillus welwitschiae]|uniref:Uncharacterized protein n=1 Tax=Aspergillus welwitschiae TaxID=1341132 RepID=A0A3F3QDR7_9EURO|nr:hypothetical protein BDQ94DRAFT_136362 [Aspergillus welwitschiae]RDH37398.1 hypothetical protein BDQ94DRAFT_136362 [Aspergillus welwitschiae]
MSHIHYSPLDTFLSRWGKEGSWRGWSTMKTFPINQHKHIPQPQRVAGTTSLCLAVKY